MTGKDVRFEGEAHYQVKYGHFHHALIKVCRPVLHDFYGYYFLSLQILTFYDLAEGPLPQHVQD